jgi:hypothetical protein
MMPAMIMPMKVVEDSAIAALKTMPRKLSYRAQKLHPCCQAAHW